MSAGRFCHPEFGCDCGERIAELEAKVAELEGLAAIAKVSWTIQGTALKMTAHCTASSHYFPGDLNGRCACGLHGGWASLGSAA